MSIAAGTFGLRDELNQASQGQPVNPIGTGGANGGATTAGTNGGATTGGTNGGAQ